MSEPCTETYSGDRDDSSGAEVDEIVVRFLKELDGSSDAREVVRHYCEAYPAKAGEFRALAGARHVLVMSEPEAEVEATDIGRLGDFHVVRQIARGGMGAIYEAVQEPFRRRVAVKTIRGDRHHLSASARDRFFREQAVLAKLHHTHIVPIHAGGQAGDLQYFAMPYIEGAALHHVVRFAAQLEATRPSGETPSLAELVQGVSSGSTAPEPGDPTPEASPVVAGADAGPVRGRAKPILSAKYLCSVAKVMADAGEALHHAHQAGVIHRDVKPSNIMVDTDEHCWVLDFGLAAFQAARNGDAHPADSRDSTDGAASGVMGTLRYMAPEQFHERADARTDVWGLGVTLYELLTLRPAFASRAQIESREPQRPREFVGNLPRDLEAICLKALCKDARRRYATAREFGDDIRRWLGQEPVRARRARALRRAALWARRNKGWAAAIIFGLGLAAIGAAAWGLIAQARERELSREALALLVEIQRIRLTPHSDGWSDDAWGLVRRAAAAGIRESHEVQSQAAALLAEVDARVEKRFGDFGGYALAFDREGARLLIASTAPMPTIKPNGSRLWHVDSGRLDVLAEGGEGPVAFRPDGTPVQLTIEVKKGERTLSLRELASGRAVIQFKVPGQLDNPNPGQIALSPDLKLAVAPFTATEGKPALGVWDTATGQLRQRFEGPNTAAAFSPDGSLLARGDDAGRVIVWSLPSEKEVASLPSGRNTIRALAFTRDRVRRADQTPDGPGWLIAAGDSGGGLTVWDVNAKTPRSFCYAADLEVTAVVFSPDGQTVVSGGRALRFWDLASGRATLRLETSDFIYGLAFSPDGHRLAVGALGFFTAPQVRVWHIERHRGVQELRGLASGPTKLAFSPDGRLVAALAHNWQIAVWDRSTGTLRHVFEAHKGLFADNASLAFGPDGHRLAFSTSGGATLWDLDTGRELKSWALPEALVDTLAFHPSGKLLLGRWETKDAQRGPLSHADAREHPRVYRVRDLLGVDPVNRPLWEIDDFNRQVFGSGAPLDGRYFVVDGLGGPDGKRRIVKVFHALTGEALFETTPDFRPGYSCIELDPSGRVLKLTEDEGQRISLLEMPSGRWLRGLEPKWSGIPGPDVRILAPKRYEESSDMQHGFSLHDQGGRHLVDLGIDSQSPFGVFDASGRTFAWGTTEGPVYLADLNEVQRRLAAVGPGW
jgi:WD40 repeat protein/serine/threonine protein kinase